MMEQMRDPLDALAEDVSALSNLQRLRLLHLLTRPRYAEEIAEALGMTRQSALKHIDKLEERGFIRAVHGRRATGPVIEYLVVPARLFAVGITIGELGKLEPEGGPHQRVNDQTQVLDAQGLPMTPQAPSSAVAQLLAIDGPTAGTRFPLTDGPRWTFGRDDDRYVRIKHDPYVSQRHAEIQEDPQGHALIDAFSSNGTFLNFSRLPRGGRVPLRPGDVIGLGHTHYVYQKE